MLTVTDLVRVGELGLRFAAGSGGGQRAIVWAKSGDRPNPWSEVASGDVLVIGGASFPLDPKAQSAWVQAAVDSGVTALIIAGAAGDHQLARESAAIAERTDFPIIETAGKLPILLAVQAVISSAMNAHQRVLDHAYEMQEELASVARTERGFKSTLDALGDRLELDIEVFSAGRETLFSTRGNRSAIPCVIELEIPGPDGGILSVMGDSDKQPDILLARHLAGFIGVELSREALRRDIRRSLGADLFRSFIQGSRDLATIETELSSRGLVGDRVVICIESGEESRSTLTDLHHDPLFKNASPLIVADGSCTLVLATLSDGLLEKLCKRSAGFILGVSAIIGLDGDIRESLRQARMAVHHAREAGRQLARYSERPVATGEVPGHGDGTSMAKSLLGNVLKYDDEHGSELVLSLTTFLENDRSWKVSAAKLGIHRQTLVYRLRLVEQLTGFRPNSTVGVAKLWLAIETGRRVGLIDV